MGGHEAGDPPWDNWEVNTRAPGAEGCGVGGKHRYERAECKLEEAQEATHVDQARQERFFSAFRGFRMKQGEIVQVPLALSIDSREPRRNGIVKQPLSPTNFLTETD